VERGFRRLALGGLALSGAALFLFLRYRGFRPAAALLGVGVLAVSGPAAEVIRYRYLAEPAALPAFVAFLAALEAGAGVGVLALLLLVGVLAKEIAFLLVPAVFLEAWPRVGAARAVRRALLVALPAAAASLVLRSAWAPHAAAAPGPSVGALLSGVPLVLAAWGDWWKPLLMGGVLPLALLGALRRDVRPDLVRYGYLMVFTAALPFAAGLYVGESQVEAFFSGDVPRLLLYALPVWLPAALGAFGTRARSAAPIRWKGLPALDWAAGLAAVGLVAALPLELDAYRRADLTGTRDGPWVLATCGESLKAAGRLERGQPVAFDASTQRFAWGRSEPTALGRMRWFLLEGWGSQAHYGLDDIVMRGSQASLLLPVLAPRDIEVVLEADLPQPARLSVFANGELAGQVGFDEGRSTRAVRLPAAALFRGDNRVSLVARGGPPPGLRLRRLEFRPAS